MSKLTNLHTFHRNIYDNGYVTNKFTGKTLKIQVTSSKKVKDSFISIEKSSLSMIAGSIKMSYEALMPLFALSGHEVRLLLFIIAYCADKNTNQFKWNPMVLDEYTELFKITTGKDVKPESVRQALVKLNKLNVINIITKGNYILNPLYSDCGNIYKQAKLFNAFLEKKIEKESTINVSKSLLTDLH
jgi:hypothetical protein